MTFRAFLRTLAESSPHGRSGPESAASSPPPRHRDVISRLIGVAAGAAIVLVFLSGWSRPQAPGLEASPTVSAQKSAQDGKLEVAAEVARMLNEAGVNCLKVDGNLKALNDVIIDERPFKIDEHPLNVERDLKAAIGRARLNSLKLHAEVKDLKDSLDDLPAFLFRKGVQDGGGADVQAELRRILKQARKGSAELDGDVKSLRESWRKHAKGRLQERNLLERSSDSTLMIREILNGDELDRVALPMLIGPAQAANPNVARYLELVMKAPEIQFNECVALMDEGGGQFGSGVLIAPDLVLTAGHMVANGRKVSRVLVGTDVKNPRGTYPVLNEATIHQPAWAEQDPGDPPARPAIVHDLAVLVLGEEVPGALARPVELATTGDIDKAQDIMIWGFGGNGDLALDDLGRGTKRYGFVHVVSCDCTGPGPDAKRISEAYGCTPGLELVAADESPDKKNHERTDTVIGDSGGPFYVVSKGTWRLGGVTSRPVFSIYDPKTVRKMREEAAKNSRAVGALALRGGPGGIYVRVDKYAPFIEEARAKARRWKQDHSRPKAR